MPSPGTLSSLDSFTRKLAVDSTVTLHHSEQNTCLAIDKTHLAQVLLWMSGHVVMANSHEPQPYAVLIETNRLVGICCRSLTLPFNIDPNNALHRILQLIEY